MAHGGMLGRAAGLGLYRPRRRCGSRCWRGAVSHGRMLGRAGRRRRDGLRRWRGLWRHQGAMAHGGVFRRTGRRCRRRRDGARPWAGRRLLRRWRLGRRHVVASMGIRRLRWLDRGKGAMPHRGVLRQADGAGPRRWWCRLTGALRKGRRSRQDGGGRRKQRQLEKRDHFWISPVIGRTVTTRIIPAVM